MNIGLIYHTWEKGGILDSIANAASTLPTKEVIGTKAYKITWFNVSETLVINISMNF